MSDDPQQRERLAHWAAAVKRRGLTTPVLMLLDLAQPLGVVASHCLTPLAPLLPSHGRTVISDIAQLLDDPEAAKAFAEELTEPAGD